MKREYISAAYIKVCMLSFLLFGISDFVFSEGDNKIEKEYDSQLYHAMQDTVAEKRIDKSSVVRAGSCINIFKDQIVTSAISVLGCDTLAVQNVTITNNGDLTLSAPGNITLNGPFMGELGSILNVKAGELQLVFEFFYDASGNRTRRQISIVE